MPSTLILEMIDSQSKIVDIKHFNLMFKLLLATLTFPTAVNGDIDCGDITGQDGLITIGFLGLEQ